MLNTKKNYKTLLPKINILDVLDTAAAIAAGFLIVVAGVVIVQTVAEIQAEVALDLLS